ncbi:PREDICTED: E3 [Prunus dulcis]|uniref:RING-type E3 ubiquitin transferase n=1 Tax=Prunus dulcis TaxID=3755 RepID=A0A5E4EZ35_PRUDU|nr:uncharacterized protein LOC117617005 [Prunus dulcis]KAI5352607.1 hypothetical protein L3X38_005498 [Prunus dulcis]VVA20440.1 PREDICTED: E3 [Prunus dulcis]
MDEEAIEVHHEDRHFSCKTSPLTPDLLKGFHDDDDERLRVNFDYEVNHIYYDVRSPDDIGTSRPKFIYQCLEQHKKTIYLEQSLLENYQDSYLVLSKAMLSFGITRDRVVRDIVDEIVKQGREARPKKFPNRLGMLFGLDVCILKDHRMYRCQQCLVASVMRESLAAEEVKMVPASESSIKKVLKKVIVGQGGESIRRNYLSVSDDVKEEEEGGKRKRRRISVSEGESCSVCMDEFEGGTTVACLPCSHVFHGECIVNWLRQSHYCPVCRFEVPTD